MLIFKDTMTTRLTCRLLTFGLLLILSITSLASDSTKTASWQDVLKTFDTKKLNVKEISSAVTQKKLGPIEVIDARPDTSIIAFYYAGGRKTPLALLGESQLFTDVIAETLTGTNATMPKVLMVVQQLWLTDVNYKEAVDLHTFQTKSAKTAKALCKIDVFIKDHEDYLPLVRIDTAISSNDYIVHSANKLLASTFEHVQSKIEAAYNEKRYVTRKKFTTETILKEYSKRFDYPINTTSAPIKGVYSSFTEFKNNKPSIANFAVRPNENEPPSLYLVDDKGNETFTRNAWGVCDGKDMYIMQSGLLFKLFKYQNGFYWMGIKDMKLRQVGIPIIIPFPGGFIYGVEPSSSFMKIRLAPYLLNIDTGYEY
jgi:hypothetical protein